LRNQTIIVEQLARSGLPVVTTGELAPAQVSCLLQAADLGIAPHPWELTGKSGVVAAMLLFPLREWVALAYTADQNAIALITPALALTCLFLAPDAVQVVAAQALRARGEVWIPTITHLISYGVIMGPLAWWLAIPMKLGVDGIVWSVIVTSFVSMAFLLGRFRMLDAKDRSLAG